MAAAASAERSLLLSLPDRIASCALHHYHTTLKGNKGKPKPNEEWTVYAAIVAHHLAEDNDNNDSMLWVVSCATGTKCTAQRHDGCIVHDAHAEVLSRRGLVRVLWCEIQRKESQQVNDSKHQRYPSLLVPSLSRKLSVANKDDIPHAREGQKYQLNPRIQLHLYISDSPCGDASIYPLSSHADGDTMTTQGPPDVLFTGAKIVVSHDTGVTSSDCGGSHQLLSACTVRSQISDANNDENGLLPHPDSTAVVVAREEKQILGKLRTKSGRSNLPDRLRSTSMSCSDKIALWGVLGLQGALLTHVLDPPVLPLTSVVVSRDPRIPMTSSYNQYNNNDQLVALERAVSFRTRLVVERGFVSLDPLATVPTMHLVSQGLSCSKSAMNEPSSTSANSQCPISGNKRKLDKVEIGRCSNLTKSKVSPCGIALNWNQEDTEIELLVGARGIRQGKKPKLPKDYENLASRLCRFKMVQEIPTEWKDNMSTKVVIHHRDNSRITYQYLKEASAFREWSKTKTKILTDSDSPFVGWIRSGCEDDFAVRSADG